MCRIAAYVQCSRARACAAVHACVACIHVGAFVVVLTFVCMQGGWGMGGLVCGVV